VIEYEIRILGRSGRPSVILVDSFSSDAAAIRAGEKIAKGGRFEVWRGLDRVYNSERERSEAA
jgi:hypothetical protein